MGTPRGKTRNGPGDLLILYGRESVLEEFDKRVMGPEGNREHAGATVEQKRVSREEQEGHYA